MKTKFEFITGEIPPSFKFQGEIALYDTPEYLNTWPETSHYSFYILNHKNRVTDGYVQFQVSGEKAYSPYKAPFGSISISENVDFDTLNGFISFIISHLRNNGIKEVIIKHYPRFYHPDTCELVITALGLNGLKISDVDINHYIEVPDTSFSAIIHPMELRKLKKCERAGYIFTEHQNTDAEMVFSFIESFRKIRKVPINIEQETMLKLIGIFPGRYKFFSVSNGKDIIAATICVHVNRRVLYNFLPAHDERYKKFSPVVYLMYGIHHYAKNEKFKLIDLGISSVHGMPQAGLIKFKERLGGKAVSKLTFVKEIL